MCRNKTFSLNGSFVIWFFGFRSDWEIGEEHLCNQCVCAWAVCLFIFVFFFLREEHNSRPFIEISIIYYQLVCCCHIQFDRSVKLIATNFSIRKPTKYIVHYSSHAHAHTTCVVRSYLILYLHLFAFDTTATTTKRKRKKTFLLLFGLGTWMKHNTQSSFNETVILR